MKVVVFLLAIGLSSCEEGGDSSDTTTATETTPTTTTPTTDGTATEEGTSAATTTGTIAVASEIDTSDYETIFISSEANQASLESEQFYGVDSSGQVGKINIFVDESSESTSLRHSRELLLSDSSRAHAVEITASYIFFALTDSSVCDLVVTRRSDDQTFCGGDLTTPNNQKISNGGQFQLDAAGNLYFVSSTDLGVPELIKIDVTDIDNPSRVTLFDNGGSADDAKNSFVVNSQGDALLFGSGLVGATIKKENGGIQNVDGSSNVVGFVQGSDFYYLKLHDTNVYKLTRQSDGSFVESTHATSAVGADTSVLSHPPCVVGTEIFGGSRHNGNVNEVYRFIDSPGAINIASEGFASWQDLKCSSSKAYILGKDSSGDGLIKAFDNSDDSWEEYVAAGDFTLYAFTVGSTGTVYFNGLRNSDGKKVYGKVDAAGASPTILSESFDQITRLVPLN